jgi:uncharacterized protein
MEYSAEDRGFLLQTACRAIRQRLQGVKGPLTVTACSEAVMRPAGCFVSLHSRETHVLRGCIGRIDTASPLVEVLAGVAWGAAADPRFLANPVTLGELPQLTVELSILGPLAPAADPMGFDLLNDGLYLTAGGRTGVFLPQVARDTGWTRQQLLDRLCSEKLGMPPHTWRQPGARLYTFSSLTIGPTDFLPE